MSFRREFSKNEIDMIKRETLRAYEVRALFFQEHTIKKLKTWIEECSINGAEKTLIQVKQYFKKLENTDG